MSLRAVSVKINDLNSAKVRNISYDSNINVKVDSNQDYKVKSFNYGIKRLSNLEDVTFGVLEDGYTLVFNSITGKFDLKKISISDLDLTSIDAGTF
jgi:hypothetical protein